MVSSAAQAGVTEAPEQVLSYGDWFRQQGYERSGIGSAYNPLRRFWNFVSGEGDRLNSEYKAYLDNVNIRNQAKAVQSARAYEEYMSNTIYSRAFKDLEKMGVNPYLLLNNGSTPATSAGSSSKADYNLSHAGLKDSKSNTGGRDFALILLALARIAATVA